MRKAFAPVRKAVGQRRGLEIPDLTVQRIDACGNAAQMQHDESGCEAETQTERRGAVRVEHVAHDKPGDAARQNDQKTHRLPPPLRSAARCCVRPVGQ